MKVMCFALFCRSLNLLLGLWRIVVRSRHCRVILGVPAMSAAHAAQFWGWDTRAGRSLRCGGGGLLGFVIASLAIAGKANLFCDG